MINGGFMKNIQNKKQNAYCSIAWLVRGLSIKDASEINLLELVLSKKYCQNMLPTQRVL